MRPEIKWFDAVKMMQELLVCVRILLEIILSRHLGIGYSQIKIIRERGRRGKTIHLCT